MFKHLAVGAEAPERVRMKSLLRILVVAFAVFIAGLANAATDGAQPIPWNAERPLTWIDYRGIPDPGASPSIGARTHLLLAYSYQYIKDYDASSRRYRAYVYASSLKVDCLFDPYESWVRPDAQSDRLLNHEQRHFDLAEVYAQKMRSALQSVTAWGASAAAAEQALKTQVAATAGQINQRWHEIDAQYDHESVGGTDPSAQALWDQRIDAWLVQPSQAP